MAKKVKKLIPKEIKPAVPYIAAYFGGPMLASKFAMNPAFAKALSASLASKVQGDDTKTALRSGIFAAAPDVVSSQLQKFSPLSPELGGSKVGQFLSQTGTKLATALDPNTASIGDMAKVIGAQSSIEGGIRAAELNEKALRDYEAQLREQGIMDSADRRNKIFGYFSGALNTKTGDRLYSDDEINSFLDKYGYAYGGRVGYNKAGLVTLDDLINKTPSGELFMSQFKIEDKDKDEDEDEDEDKPRPKFSTKNLMSGLDYASKGLETAFGRPIDMKPQPTRFGLAEGGIPVTQNARKTIKELIEAGMLEDEGEGILDLIRKNPDMIGGPIMPTRPETFDLESYKTKVNNLPMFIKNFIDDFRQENGRNPTPEEIKMYAQKVTPFGFADGGMLNFGGREMDMRGGGFIPIGAKERADDVPARLSKNEFVMTADAVRAAGGGSINKGAKRMYDLMNKLESKV